MIGIPLRLRRSDFIRINGINKDINAYEQLIADFPDENISVVYQNNGDWQGDFVLSNNELPEVMIE